MSETSRIITLIAIAHTTLIGLTNTATILAQEKPFGDTPPALTPTTPEAPLEQFVVTFTTGERTSLLSPPFSPKGTQFELTPQEVKNLPGINHLTGKIELGPQPSMPAGIAIAFSRSQPDQPYDQLFADTNLNGDLTDETPITATPKLTRDKWWSSFDSITLKVRHPDQLIEYPVSFWIVVESPAEQPTVARFSRRGFLQGSFTKDDKTYNVAITDGNNDALFNTRDSWAISLSTTEGSKERGLWRTINDFTWGNEQAWKLTLNGTNGCTGIVTPFDAGLTQADDKAMRDHLRADKLAARAEKPLTFEHDYEAAIKLATESGKPCFIKFETDWCGPCKTMHQLVFTAKDVVDASQGVVCVTVDGDKRKDLTEKFKVTSYPTGIFLDKFQSESTRFNGYRSVKQMTEAFQNAPR